MAKLTLQALTSGYNAVPILNANGDAIEEALENTVSLDGTSPNEMQVDFSMGGNRLINLAAPINPNDAVRLIDVANIVAGGDVDVTPTVSWNTDITNRPARLLDIAALVDPNVDRLVFWDDSAGALVYLTLGTGLAITGTTINASVASVAWAGITGVPAYVTSLGLLADPGADRLLFWDDSATNIAQLTLGAGLSITGTTISFSLLGLQSLVDPNADRIYFWDDSAGASAFLSLGSGLAITGTQLDLSAGIASFGALVDPNADRILFWDDSAGAHVYLEPIGHLGITGTQIAYTSTTGTFLGTLTGISGAPVTGNIKYTKNGNAVTIQLPVLSGAANSTAHTITGAPAAIFPTTAQSLIGITENNAVVAFGKVVVETTGTLTLFNGASTAVFAGTSTEGAPAQTLTYHLS